MDTGTSMYDMGPPLLDTSLHPMAMVFMGMLDTILYELTHSRINVASSANYTEPHAAEIHMHHQEYQEQKKDGRSPIIIRTNNKTKTPIYIDLVKGKIHNRLDEDSEPRENDISDNNNSICSDDTLLEKIANNKTDTSHKNTSRGEKDVYYDHNSENIDNNVISNNEKDIDQNDYKFNDEEMALKNNDADASAKSMKKMLKTEGVSSFTDYSLHKEKVDELKTNMSFSNEQQIVGDGNLTNKSTIENNNIFLDEREILQTKDGLPEKTLKNEQSIDGQGSDNQNPNNESSILQSSLTKESSHVPNQGESFSENKGEQKDKPHKIRFHRRNRHDSSDSSSASSSSSSYSSKRNRRKNYFRNKSRRSNFFDDFACNKFETTRKDDPITQNVPDDMFYFSPFDITFSPFDIFNNIFTPPPFSLTNGLMNSDNNKDVCGPNSPYEYHEHKEFINDINSADISNDIYGSHCNQKRTSPDVLHGNPIQNMHINARGITSVAPDSLEDSGQSVVLEYPECDVPMTKPFPPTPPTPPMEIGSEGTSMEEPKYIRPKTLLRLDGAIPTSPTPTQDNHWDKEHDINIEENLKTENMDEFIDGWLLCDGCYSGISWSECWVFSFNGPFALVSEEEDKAIQDWKVTDDTALEREDTHHKKNQEAKATHDEKISINTTATVGEQSDPETNMEINAKSDGKKSHTNITSTKNDGSTQETTQPKISEKSHTMENKLDTNLTETRTNETLLDSLQVSNREDSKKKKNKSKLSDNTSRVVVLEDILNDLTTSPANKTKTTQKTQRNEAPKIDTNFKATTKTQSTQTNPDSELKENKETKDKNAQESKPTEKGEEPQQHEVNRAETDISHVKVKDSQGLALDVNSGNRADTEQENDKSPATTAREAMHKLILDLSGSKTTSVMEGRSLEEKNEVEGTLN